MSEQPELITVHETPLPALLQARKELKAIESAIPSYLKFTVERTSISEIYIRVAPGTNPKDVPRALLKNAAIKLADSDWGYGSDHRYLAYDGRRIDAVVAETYPIEDATGIEQLRAEVARLEKEAVERLCEKKGIDSGASVG